MAKITWFKSLL